MARAVSAPGKVLLAGGYLVLDRAHTGLVFGLDARIHAHVQPLSTIDGVSLQEIVVRSPQFEGATWRYGYSMGKGRDSGVIITELKSGHPSESASPNDFIETALAYAFTYILAVSESPYIAPSTVTILADNDYYSAPSSTGATRSQPTLSERPRFNKFPTTLELTHKTGLGSSAALVSSFIAAILTHYLPVATFSPSQHQKVLHNLAQAAHCAAQGKVGSGFDIASAVFGSSVYRRFSPHLLETLGDLSSDGFSNRLKTLVQDEDKIWDEEIQQGAVKMPKDLRLVMVDVDCGSKTPGMVKKVLDWRKSNRDVAQRLWTDLQNQNEALATELVRLAETGGCSDLRNLRGTILRVRALLREMSSQAQVPIEPEAQTKLLNACSNIDGVVGGVTPGAGGFDAVVLVIEDKPEVLSSLERLLQDWQFRNQDSRESKVCMLGVREDMRGIQEEDPEAYKAWIA